MKIRQLMIATTLAALGATAFAQAPVKKKATKKAHKAKKTTKKAAVKQPAQ